MLHVLAGASLAMPVLETHAWNPCLKPMLETRT